MTIDQAFSSSIETLSSSSSRESIAHCRHETSQNAVPAKSAISIETSVTSLPHGPWTLPALPTLVTCAHAQRQCVCEEACC